MLTLPSNCNRAAARALHDDLRAAVGDDPVEVDASKVETIGQATIQVLLSASQTQGGIDMQNPSQAFDEAAQITGLGDHFGEGLQS